MEGGGQIKLSELKITLGDERITVLTICKICCILSGLKNFTQVVDKRDDFARLNIVSMPRVRNVEQWRFLERCSVNNCEDYLTSLKPVNDGCFMFAEEFYSNIALVFFWISCGSAFNTLGTIHCTFRTKYALTFSYEVSILLLFQRISKKNENEDPNFWILWFLFIQWIVYLRWTVLIGMLNDCVNFVRLRMLYKCSELLVLLLLFLQNN